MKLNNVFASKQDVNDSKNTYLVDQACCAISDMEKVCNRSIVTT